jgi:amino acid adenylation domain-containing protein
MRLLQEGVARRAEARPEAVALVEGTARISYGELERLTNRLSHCLRMVGCREGDRIGILAPKSIHAIAGILGTLKGGCIYVPLDPASPAPRLEKILCACECRVVLAAGEIQGPVQAMLEQLPRPVLLGWLDRSWELGGPMTAFTAREIEEAPDGPSACRRKPEDIAHILFTSGSTGTPKGVTITHANVAAFLDWALPYFGHTPEDRISSHPPLHFDLSTFDIFGTLWSGASLYLVPPTLSLLPHKLAEFIRTSALTQWFSVPSLLNYMSRFNVVRPGDFPSLKRLLWCGEPFPTPALIYWMRRLPHVSFTNLYGPTETTIASSYYRVTRCPAGEQENIPVGTACPGEELLVLDASLCPVAAGEVGELYIRGAGLSPGYWQDAEKTAAAFNRDPFSADPAARIYKTGDLASTGERGLVYLHGRADMQIKSRGYRIELGEIEAALNAIDKVRECAVTAIDADGFEGQTICCAYAAAAGQALPPQVLRARLAASLPAYMIPGQWMALERLPWNANGKIDRPKIKAMFSARLQECARAAGGEV